MKVSIITVCLNNEDTIRDSIDSVLSQTYGFIEYLIVDGGSTDSTLDIVYSYGDRIARVISEPDEGIYDAMNKGIRNATGDIVATLNADDFYIDDEVISDVVGLMQQTGAEASIGDLFIVDQMDVSRIIRYCDSSMFDVSKFAYGWMPPHPGFFVRKIWYERLGMYRTDYQISADFELLVRFLGSAGLPFCRVNRPIVKMRRGGVSTRGLRSTWILNREIVRACRENGIKTALLIVLLKIPYKFLEYFRRPF